MSNTLSPRAASIFDPDSAWLTICLVVCGVLAAVGPPTPDNARWLMLILRQELARSGLLTKPGVTLEPWHYLTERINGRVILSAAGRQLQQQSPDAAVTRAIHNTLTQWRENHDQAA